MITSTANGQIKELVKLQKSAKERKKTGCFIAEGIKLVKEAFLEDMLEKVYLLDKLLEDSEIKELCDQTEYELVAESVFLDIADTVTPQGILGIVRQPKYSAEELINSEKGHFLLLEDLRDPGNLGTIMRTAEGAGMNAVLLSKGSVDLFNPKVVRATMGSVFRVPFCYAEDLGQVIDALKARGIPVYGTMMKGSKRYNECDYRSGAGIVIGNEANGISEDIAAHLSGTVMIPMAGRLESLNAAVAAAVLMYEMIR